MLDFLISILAYIVPDYTKIQDYNSFFVSPIKVEESEQISSNYQIKEINFDTYNDYVNYYNKFPNSIHIPDSEKTDWKSFLIKVWISNLKTESSSNNSLNNSQMGN